jgi:hypothetical protein
MEYKHPAMAPAAPTALYYNHSYEALLSINSPNTKLPKIDNQKENYLKKNL